MDKQKVAEVSLKEVGQLLGSSSAGLSSSEAAERLKKYGPNSLKKNNQNGILKILGRQLNSSLVYLLIIASLLSFALKDINDGVVIAVILLINSGLSFYQTYRSDKALAKLEHLVGKESLVIRDGHSALISERLLVPGDLTVLKEGDVVPADIRLIEATDLSVNESQLSGESAPVVKDCQKDNLVFAGSVIEKGEAKGFVYATAEATQLGKIAHLSASTKRVTQYEKSMALFSKFLVRVTFVTLAAVFALKLILVHSTANLGDLILFIIALSIAVVPEAMPVIVTVTLSRGALKLARCHVITKTLTAVEDLGNVSVLCTDKTGTLTENRQTIKKLVSSDQELFQVLAIASLESLDEKRQKFQSAFDRAFLNFVGADLKRQGQAYKRLLELPFDPAARRRRVVVTNGQKTYLVEVGSVETLLELTNDPGRSKYLKVIKADGLNGLRHLGIAYKPVRYKEGFDILKNEQGLKLAGFVSLEDPLRPSARRTIELAEKLGLKIKILSGDSPEVTKYVASQIGLISPADDVLSGDQVDKLSDEELGSVAASTHAFARLNPEQKYRLIKILKNSGEVVGYQGDGINDAPSLKLADVAIAVSNATDVAQESADILLLRSDLGVIVNGIRSGREIFANINKYIRFTFVSNWGNFFALSALFLLSVSSLPILPVQVLLTSLLTDLPCLTIATDNVDTTELMMPSRFNIHALMFISLFLGSLTAVFEIMYYALIKSQPTRVVETGLYLFLTLSALIVIFSVRNRGHFYKAPRLSQSMKYAFAVVFAVALSLIYVPATQKVLSFSVLPLKILALTVGLTLVYFGVMDSIKTWFYKTNLKLLSDKTT